VRTVTVHKVTVFGWSTNRWRSHVIVFPEAYQRLPMVVSVTVTSMELSYHCFMLIRHLPRSDIVPLYAGFNSNRLPSFFFPYTDI